MVQSPDTGKHRIIAHLLRYSKKIILRISGNTYQQLAQGKRYQLKDIDGAEVFKREPEKNVTVTARSPENSGGNLQMKGQIHTWTFYNAGTFPAREKEFEATGTEKKGNGRLRRLWPKS